MSRIGGLKDGTVTGSGQYEATDTGAVAIRTAFDSQVLGFAQIQFFPAAAALSKGFEVAVFVESFEISATVDGRVEFSFTSQFNALPTKV